MAGKQDRRKPSVREVSARRMGAHASGTGDGASDETLISRRRLLYGAVGIGAVAAIGGGAFALQSANRDDGEITYLGAPADALATLNEFEALDGSGGIVAPIGEFDLPYGSLIWADDDEVAACLLPTETGSPLVQAGLVFLGAGTHDTVLERAVGTVDSFEIYDVRANGAGMAWTEANILKGAWRVYTAPLSGGILGEARLAAEGDDAFDMPSIAVAGTRAFWLENPKSPLESGLPARLRSVEFGEGDVADVFESRRRMATPPYSSDGSITIAPRIDAPSVYYQLTNIDARSGEVRDTLTLPPAVAPVEAGYGPTGFMFAFPDIYNYEGAVSNLGTYAPRSKPADGNYDGVQWFDFTRTPTAAPAWCGDLLVVKSTRAVCGVDLAAGEYFAIDVEDGADTYGEYLASSGVHDTFVTYTNIDHTPIGAAAIHTCRVKVWTPLSQAEREAWREARAAEADAEGEDDGDEEDETLYA